MLIIFNNIDKFIGISNNQNTSQYEGIGQSIIPPIHTHKFIICKPRGGMIDMLSLITMSLKYAEKYNRILIIDTSKSLHFKDNFYKYFSTNNKYVYSNDIDYIYGTMKDKTLYQNKISINYMTYDPFIDPNDTIDLNKDYIEDIILFGNDNSYLDRDIVYFFRNFLLKPIIYNVLKDRYDSLPIDYISIHIRNTDHKSDVDGFIKDNYKIFNSKNIFLATDDHNILIRFQKLFKNIYTFTKFTDSKEMSHNRMDGLHFIVRNEMEHEIYNIDTMCDFLLLASSNDYYYATANGFARGFSLSAKILFDEKELIKNIINNIR